LPTANGTPAPHPPCAPASKSTAFDPAAALATPAPPAPAHDTTAACNPPGAPVLTALAHHSCYSCPHHCYYSPAALGSPAVLPAPWHNLGLLCLTTSARCVICHTRVDLGKYPWATGSPTTKPGAPKGALRVASVAQQAYGAVGVGVGEPAHLWVGAVATCQLFGGKFGPTSSLSVLLLSTLVTK